MSASKDDSQAKKPTIIDAIKKAHDAGMSVSIEEGGIVVTVPEEKPKPDPKAALSEISPKEEKQLEAELKGYLKPKGEKNAEESKSTD